MATSVFRLNSTWVHDYKGFLDSFPHGFMATSVFRLNSTWVHGYKCF